MALKTALEHRIPSLVHLANEIAAATRSHLLAGLERDRGAALRATAHQGAGDVTFGIDVPAERAAAAWFEREAARSPLSLLTEDSGWRHLGPAPSGSGVVELEGFDHGGPRIALDPIDGTRNLMTDLRSAWVVVSACEPGPEEPRIDEVAFGLLGELPDSRAALRRTLLARRDAGCQLVVEDLESGAELSRAPLRADDDDRVDHGYFPFFRYAPDLRPAIAEIEAAFFARLERYEGADVRNCFDDQYICSAGQLALLALGTYRFVTDLRPIVAAAAGCATVPSKPYDVAGAILVAREAGCIVEHPAGSQLDFPLDVRTPVTFAAYANSATSARLRRHLRKVLPEQR